MSKETIHISKCLGCAEAINLQVGSDIKRYVELVAKSEKTSISRYVISLAESEFDRPDKKYGKAFRFHASLLDLSVSEFAVSFFEQNVKPKSSKIHLLELDERVELFVLMGKFRRTTFWYNVIRYLEGGAWNLSWMEETLRAINELKETDLLNQIK